MTSKEDVGGAGNMGKEQQINTLVLPQRETGTTAISSGRASRESVDLKDLPLLNYTTVGNSVMIVRVLQGSPAGCVFFLFLFLFYFPPSTTTPAPAALLHNYGKNANQTPHSHAKPLFQLCSTDFHGSDAEPYPTFKNKLHTQECERTARSASVTHP